MNLSFQKLLKDFGMPFPGGPRSFSRRVLPFLLPFSLMAILVILAMHFNIIMNCSESLPWGLWKKSDEAVDISVLKMRYVKFCPPNTDAFRLADRLGILHAGRGCSDRHMPMLKQVFAIPGDTIELGKTVKVNGMDIPNSELIAEAAFRFHVKEGTFVVPGGKVWLMSNYNRWSFDSRYLGLVTVDSSFSIVEPLLVLNEME